MTAVVPRMRLREIMAAFERDGDLGRVLEQHFPNEQLGVVLRYEHDLPVEAYAASFSVERARQALVALEGGDYRLTVTTPARLGGITRLRYFDRRIIYGHLLAELKGYKAI